MRLGLAGMDGAGRLRGVDKSMEEEGSGRMKDENIDGDELTRGNWGWSDWFSHGRCVGTRPDIRLV